MFTDPEKSPERAPSLPALDPFAIAAGLLRNDVPVLVPVLLVLAIASVAQGLFEPKRTTELFGLMFFDRLSQLGAMSFIVLRWRFRLEHVKSRSGTVRGVVTRILIVGFFIWASLAFPLIAATVGTPSWAAPLFIFAFFVAFFWSIKLYFYFAAIGLLGARLRGVWGASVAIYRKEPVSVVRSLVAPLAVMALVKGLLAYPSPDGRSLFWATMTSAADGILWVLTTYTALAYALVLIDESSWRSAGLEPYRKERLRTLEAQGRASHFNWLSPRSGFKMLFVALCVWVGAVFQQFTVAPAADITIERCEARNHGLSVVLSLSDPQYKFRGFNPYAFSIASQTGFQISSGVAKVSLAPGGEQLQEPLTGQSGPVKIYLEFRSNKTEEALGKLDNMFLWYHSKALLPLQVQVAPEDGVSP